MSNNFSNAIFRHTHARQHIQTYRYMQKQFYCTAVFVAAEDGWIDGVFVGSYRGHSSFLFVVMFLTAHYERISWTFPVQYTELQCQVISAHCQVVFSSPSGASQCQTQSLQGEISVVCVKWITDLVNAKVTSRPVHTYLLHLLVLCRGFQPASRTQIVCLLQNTVQWSHKLQ